MSLWPLCRPNRVGACAATCYRTSKCVPVVCAGTTRVAVSSPGSAWRCWCRTPTIPTAAARRLSECRDPARASRQGEGCIHDDAPNATRRLLHGKEVDAAMRDVVADHAMPALREHRVDGIALCTARIEHRKRDGLHLTQLGDCIRRCRVLLTSALRWRAAMVAAGAARGVLIAYPDRPCNAR